MSNLEPKVFISHSSIDDSVTRDLEEWLTRLGFTCWVYYQDPDPNFRRSIQRAIESHDFFLLVSSRNAYEKSIEVDKEILWAHQHKRQLCIYKIDDYAFPEGIAYLLSKTKWVEANAHGADSFADLATQMLTSIGLEVEAASLKINKINADINMQQQEEAKRKKLHQEKWLDELWTYRYNYSLKRSRTLDAWDKRKLDSLGDELGISEEDRAKYRKKYKRCLRSFKTAFSKALSGNRLDKRDIRELEKARLDSCIPLEEARRIVQDELLKHLGVISLTKGAVAEESWVVLIIKNFAHGAKTGLAHLDSEDDDLISADTIARLPNDTCTEEISDHFRGEVQDIANVCDKNQLVQVNRAIDDHTEIYHNGLERLLEIKAKCHLQWKISEDDTGRCWLRRIKMSAGCLYFWGFGHDLTLWMQDIQSVEISGPAIEVKLRDGSSNVEINCFGDESLYVSLLNCFSTREYPFFLDKGRRSEISFVNNRRLKEGHRASVEARQLGSEAVKLPRNSSSISGSSPLANVSEFDSPEIMMAKILDAFRDADTCLFKTLSCYAKDQVARARAIRNHGLQKHSVQDVYLFINTSLFRGKNGILVCDSILSIKELFEKPVHFELFSPLSGALTLDVTVTGNTRIDMIVKREICKADGTIETRSVRILNLETSNSALARPFHKELVEQELPALVRILGVIQKQRLGLA